MRLQRRTPCLAAAFAALVIATGVGLAATPDDSDSRLDPRAAVLSRPLDDAASTEARLAAAVDPDDVRWSDAFALPFVDGRIMDFAEYRGELVACGSFRQIGGEIVNFIARWNGVAWKPMADGLDGPARTLEVIDDALYVGGTFDHAGGVSAEGLARWNGVTWSAVGVGFGGSVNAIAAHLGGIAVAGDVTVGGSAVNIAQWDGTQWSVLLLGLDETVYDLAVYQGELVAGGFFRQRNGVPLLHVARFDGADWVPLGAGIGGAEVTPAAVTVTSLAVHGSDLWAVGYFDRADGQAVVNVARWGGASWSRPSELWGFPRMLRVIGGMLYAGGSTWQDSLGAGPLAGVRGWTGSAWAAPASNAREPATALGSFRDTLVIGAPDALDMEDVSVLRAAGWRALRTPWRPRDRGLTGPAHIEAVRALLKDDVGFMAGGDFVVAGSVAGLTPARGAALRVGGAWFATEGLGLGTFDGHVNALCVYDGSIVAGGRFMGTSVGGTPFQNVAVGLGTGWNGLSGGLDGDVFALAVFQGELIAGGNFTHSDGIEVRGLARWNGARWAPLGPPATSGTPPAVVYALQAEADTLWVGGSFIRMGGVPMTNIARWDGIEFHDVVFGVRVALTQGGYVSAMARYQGRLIVAGTFDRAGVIDTRQIAAWNGESWEPFGTQTWDGDVLDLEVVGGTLWAGGRFRELGTPTLNLASWNGDAWDVPGTGPAGVVYAIAADGDALYAGGAFSIAGGKSAFGLARWDPPRAPSPPGTVAVIEASPNPMSGSATIAFALTSPGDYEIAIHDLGGRRVFQSGAVQAVAGEQRVTWNGRSDDGGLVPAGLYFVRVTVAGVEHGRGRIAVVR